MPNGSRHVPCARAMASRKSAAASSSQCTESLLCAEGGDCVHALEAQSALMEGGSDVYKCPPVMGTSNDSTATGQSASVASDAARAAATHSATVCSARRTPTA